VKIWGHNQKSRPAAAAYKVKVRQTALNAPTLDIFLYYCENIPMSGGTEYCWGDQHTMKLYDSFAKSLDATEARTIILKISRVLSQIVKTTASSEAIDLDFEISFEDGAERVQCAHASRILLSFIYDRCKIADKTTSLRKASSDVIRCMAVATKSFLQQVCAMLSHPINPRPDVPSDGAQPYTPQLPLRIFVARLLFLLLSIVPGSTNIKFQVFPSTRTPLKNYDEAQCSKNLKQLLYVLGCLRPKKTWGQMLYDNKGTILLVVGATVALGVAVVYSNIRGSNSKRTKELKAQSVAVAQESTWSGISYIRLFHGEQDEADRQMVVSFREHYRFLKLHRNKLIKASAGMRYAEDPKRSLIISGVGAGVTEYRWLDSENDCIANATPVVRFIMGKPLTNARRNLLHILPMNSIFMSSLPAVIKCKSLFSLLHSPSQKRYLTVFKKKQIFRPDVAKDTLMLLQKINKIKVGEDWQWFSIETVWQTPVMLVIKAIHQMRPVDKMQQQTDSTAETTFLSNIEDVITTDASDQQVRRFYGVIQGMKAYVAQNLLDIARSDRFYYVWTCLTYFASKLQLQEILTLWDMSPVPENILMFYSIDVNPWFASLWVDFLESQNDDHDGSCRLLAEFLNSNSSEHKDILKRLIRMREIVAGMIPEADETMKEIEDILNDSNQIPLDTDSFDFVVSIAEFKKSLNLSEVSDRVRSCFQKLKDACLKLSLKPFSQQSPFYDIIKHDHDLIDGSSSMVPKIVSLLFQLLTVIVTFAAGFVKNYVRNTHEIMEMIHLANQINDCFYSARNPGIDPTTAQIEALKQQLGANEQEINIGFVSPPEESTETRPILSDGEIATSFPAEMSLLKRAGSMKEVVKRPDIYFKALSRLLNQRLKNDDKPSRDFGSQMGVLQNMLGGARYNAKEGWTQLLDETSRRVIDWFMKTSETVFFAADNKTKNNVLSFAWNAINPLNMYDRTEIAEHAEIQMSLLAGFIANGYGGREETEASAESGVGASKAGIAASAVAAGGLILASGGTALLAAGGAVAVSSIHVASQSTSGDEFVDPIKNGRYTAIGDHGLMYTRTITDGDNKCTVVLEFLLGGRSTEAITIREKYIQHFTTLKSLYSKFGTVGKSSSILMTMMMASVQHCHFVVSTMKSGRKIATTTIPFPGYMDYKLVSLIPTLESLDQLTGSLQGVETLPDTLDISAQLFCKCTQDSNGNSIYCEGKPIEKFETVVYKQQKLMIESTETPAWYGSCWSIPGCLNFSEEGGVECTSYSDVRGVGQNVGRTLLMAADLEAFKHTGKTTELNLKTITNYLNSQTRDSQAGLTEDQQDYVFDLFPLPHRKFRQRLNPKLSKDLFKTFVKLCTKYHPAHPMINHQNLFQLKVVLPYAFCVNNFWLNLTGRQLKNIQLSFACMVFEAGTAQRGMCFIDHVEPDQNDFDAALIQSKDHVTYADTSKDLLHFVPFSVARTVIQMNNPSVDTVEQFFRKPTINRQIVVYNRMQNNRTFLDTGMMRRIAEFVVETIDNSGRIQTLLKIPVESAENFTIATSYVNLFSPRQTVAIDFNLLKVGKSQQYLFEQIARRYRLFTDNGKLPKLADTVEFHTLRKRNYSSPHLYSEDGTRVLIDDNEFIVKQVVEGFCMISQHGYNYWVFSQFLVYKGWDYLSNEKQDPVVELSVVKFLDMFYVTTKKSISLGSEVLNCLTSRQTSTLIEPCSQTIRNCVACDVKRSAVLTSLEDVFTFESGENTDTCDCSTEVNQKLNLADTAKPWRTMILLYHLADQRIFLESFGGKLNDRELTKKEILEHNVQFTIDPRYVTATNDIEAADPINPNIEFVQQIRKLGREKLHPAIILRSTGFGNLSDFIQDLSSIVWKQCSSRIGSDGNDQPAKGFNYKIMDKRPVKVVNTLFVSPALLRTMQRAFQYASMCVVVLQPTFQPIQYKSDSLTLFGKLTDLQKAITTFGIDREMVSYVIVAQILKDLSHACMQLCQQIDDYDRIKTNCQDFAETIRKSTLINQRLTDKKVPTKSEVDTAYQAAKDFASLATCCINYQCLQNMFDAKNLNSTSCQLRQTEALFMGALPLYDTWISTIESVTFRKGTELFQTKKFTRFIEGRTVKSDAEINELSVMMLITAYIEGADAIQSLADVWQPYLQKISIGSMLCCALRNINGDTRVFGDRSIIPYLAKYNDVSVKFGDTPGIILRNTELFLNSLGMDTLPTSSDGQSLKPAMPMGTTNMVPGLFDGSGVHGGYGKSEFKDTFILEKGIAALIRLFCNYDSQTPSNSEIRTEPFTIDQVTNLKKRRDEDVLASQLLLQLVLTWFSISYGYYRVAEDLVEKVGMGLAKNFGSSIIDACEQWNGQSSDLVQLLLRVWQTAHTDREKEIEEQRLLLWRQGEQAIPEYLYADRSEVEKHGLTERIDPSMLPQSVYSFRMEETHAAKRQPMPNDGTYRNPLFSWSASRTMTSALIPTWTHCCARKSDNYFVAQFFSRRTEQRMNEDFKSPSWTDLGPNAFWRQPESDHTYDVPTCPLVGVDFGVNSQVRNLCKYDYYKPSWGADTMTNKYSFVGLPSEDSLTWFSTSPFARFEDGTKGRFDIQYLYPSCHFIFRCFDLLRPGTVYTENDDVSNWYLTVWFQIHMGTHVQEDHPSPNSQPFIRDTELYDKAMKRLLPYDLTIVEGYKQSVCGAFDRFQFHTSKSQFGEGARLFRERREPDFDYNLIMLEPSSFTAKKLETGVRDLETVPINGDLFYLSQESVLWKNLSDIYVVRHSDVSNAELDAAPGSKYEGLFKKDAWDTNIQEATEVFRKFANLAVPSTGIRAYKFSCEQVVTTSTFERGNSTTQDMASLPDPEEVTISSSDYKRIKLLTADEFANLHKQKQKTFVHAACILVSQMQAITDPFNSEHFFRTEKLQRPIDQSELTEMAKNCKVKTTWNTMDGTEFSELVTSTPTSLTGPVMPNGVPLRLDEDKWPVAKTFIASTA
jgi:hypothetical protein